MAAGINYVLNSTLYAISSKSYVKMQLGGIQDFLAVPEYSPNKLIWIVLDSRHQFRGRFYRFFFLKIVISGFLLIPTSDQLSITRRCARMTKF
jgi:hypothetical protein